jgi:hypothetical protein
LLLDSDIKQPSPLKLLSPSFVAFFFTGIQKDMGFDVKHPHVKFLLNKIKEDMKIKENKKLETKTEPTLLKDNKKVEIKMEPGLLPINKKVEIKIEPTLSPINFGWSPDNKVILNRLLLLKLN